MPVSCAAATILGMIKQRIVDLLWWTASLLILSGAFWIGWRG
jgi:hypothetical protein